MEEINFIGERLLPGKVGNFFIVLAFVSAIFTALSYFFSTNITDDRTKRSWKTMGRIGFGLHGLSIVAIIAILFFIIKNHYFEYNYVYHHSSLELLTQYLLACFWEGQEGSYLLWAFWHVVLASILVATAKKWEAPVMSVLFLIQLILSSMLLGVYLFGYKIGGNPFVLLRNEMTEAPIFLQANYLEFITDGTGLNPILQNYWMVIHPPILFLGFAASAIPFSYAVSGLWKKDYTGWTTPVRTWTLFACMILGTGIIMGAAWAYEALSFGGYWAWDPVENASLVPWLVLLAGLHTLMAYKHSGHALRSTFLLFIIAFFLVLYSTFLTRSGILGDSSVHSFTDLGMSGQLLLYIIALIVPAALLLIINWRKIPAIEKEEEIYTREFWMFIAALVFLLSVIHITFVTSFPVINKIFGTNLAPPTDPIASYNKLQIWIALILALLSAVTQYFKYRKSDLKRFIKRMTVSVVIASVLTIMILFAGSLRTWYYAPFLFAVLFTISANLIYLIWVIKGKIKIAGGSVAHVGFGLFLLGILISGAEKRVISVNTSGRIFEGYEARDNFENILLVKNEAVRMADYQVTYRGDSTDKGIRYFEVEYENVSDGSQGSQDKFTLFPNVQESKNMGDVANPDTRHYWHKDIYTHVTAVSANEPSDSLEFETYTISIGDTIPMEGFFIVLEGFVSEPTNPAYQPVENDIAVGAQLKIHELDSTYYAEPVYVIRDRRFEYVVESFVQDLGMTIKLTKINPERNTFDFAVAREDATKDYIIMRAILFPGINLVWLGAIFIMIGFIISLIRRYNLNKTQINES